MELTDKTAVVISVDEPTVIAYLNVYEKGDVWIKIKGCESCGIEDRLYCCGNCVMLLKDTGECRLHLGFNKREKPFHCVTDPPPNICHAWCSLEFKCIEGSRKGKIRRVSDRKGFINGST